MSLKTEIIDHIIQIEGGFVDDADDSGGATKYGITEAVARRAGYSGDMRDLPYEVAFVIYADRYWHSVCGDDLAALSENVAREVVDTAVNMGPSRAGTFLQRALNVLNDRGTLYPDLVVDGAIGARTVEALGRYLATRNELALSRALNCLQGAFYIELAERREKDERFIYGWLKNRVVI